MARKKKIVEEEPENVVEVVEPEPELDTVATEPLVDSPYDPLKALVKARPSVEDVQRNPMLYHEWALKLERLIA